VKNLVKKSVKKLLFVLLFGMVPLTYADVSSKVAELRITKVEAEETTPMEYLNIETSSQPIVTASNFVCSAGFIDGVGDLITAKHCIEEAATVTVLTSDNQSYKGTIISSSELQDLALIHIDRLGTPYFVMASSVSQGEEISTFGSPLALTGTQSWGKVARLSGDLIFMDESVLPGNSGGVVFNKNGEMVGCAISIAVVGPSLTHLSQAQGPDSIRFFLRKNRKALSEYDMSPIFHTLSPNLRPTIQK